MKFSARDDFCDFPEPAKHRSVVWPEGLPERARYSTGWASEKWLEFWLGLLTWFPDPKDARRICTLRVAGFADPPPPPQALAEFAERL